MSANGMGSSNNKSESYIYAHIAPLFQPIENVPQELSQILNAKNLQQTNVQELVKDNKDILSYFSCIDCRQGNCEKHNFNIIGGGTGAAMIGYIGLQRTKGNRNWKLDQQKQSLFDTTMIKCFMDFYNNNPGTLHTHDTTGLLTLDKLNTEDKLKENVTCGALKNLFHGALFDTNQQLKIKSNDFNALLDIYNITIDKGRASYVNGKEPHAATHAIAIDYDTPYKEIKEYSNQEDILTHLPTDYITTINTKVDDQSAYVLDYKVSHMLLQMYMYNFIDYLREQNNAGLTLLLKDIVVGHGLMKDTDRPNEDNIYDAYKKIFAGKLSNQLERSRHNTAGKVAKLASLVEKNPENLIKKTQSQLKNIKTDA